MQSSFEPFKPETGMTCPCHHDSLRVITVVHRGARKFACEHPIFKGTIGITGSTGWHWFDEANYATGYFEPEANEHGEIAP
jgi:hypothetical protein